ncbi:MAG: DUF3179 domain-containing protein [Thiohalomonadales bacterium]
MKSLDKTQWLPPKLRSGIQLGIPITLLLVLFCNPLVAASSTIDRSQWPITDFSKHNISLAEIFSGGPPKDGIPAIDKPLFISSAHADKWLREKEPVIVVEIHGEARAYPIQILIFHEIVNDRIQGIPISVTFCPLCNTAIVFNRQLGKQTLDFGTTGNLRKSDLLMYDRQTESWWQQFLGEAVVGKFTGTVLKQLSASVVSYQAFKKQYPTGQILSRETGFARNYGNNPYQGYDRIDQKPFLYFDPLDARLPAMARVLGLVIDGKSKIYPLSKMTTKKIVSDQFMHVPLVIFATESMNSALDAAQISNSRLISSATIYTSLLDGKQLSFQFTHGQITDMQTGSVWSVFGNAVSGPLKGKSLTPLNAGVHFAFAWLAFRPDSLIY